MRSCFLVLVGLAALARAADPDCFQPGECLMSPYLDDEGTSDLQECLDLCRETDFCSYWTVYQDENLCFLFQDCIEYGVDTCEDCYSGPKECEGEL